MLISLLRPIKHKLDLMRKKSKDQYSRCLYEVSSRKRDSEKLLEESKGLHKGKRAFIVCNGPSLKAEDLTKIHQNGDISFASNKINSIFNQTDWRPDYYCVFDEGYQHTILDIMNEVPAKIKFFRQSSFKTTRKVTSPCIWLNADGDVKLLDGPKFSDDISEVIYTIATVTYTMIQIAVYMGIRELYIIGCDNSYAQERTKDGKIINKGGASYFKGSDIENTKSITAAVWQMDIAYHFLSQYASKNSIKVLNATRGGYLEEFPRVDFDSLF